MADKQNVQSEKTERTETPGHLSHPFSESVLSAVILCYDSDTVRLSLLPTGWRDESDSEENKVAGRNLQGLHSHQVETRHCNRSCCSLLTDNIHCTTVCV